MESGFSFKQLMLRYNLPAEKNLLYAYEELKGIEIDREFIHALLQLFEDDKAFKERDFNKFSLETIVDYLRRTHYFYLTKKLLEIEQSIHILLKDYSADHPLLHILNDFYISYRKGLTEHINEEEKHLLPYINYLLSTLKCGLDLPQYHEYTKDYSIRSFINSHQDTEMDLSEVRKCISVYHPPATNETPYRILMTQLEAFEKDLSVHALIEDNVLIPRALKLEQSLNRIFMQKVKLN